MKMATAERKRKITGDQETSGGKLGEKLSSKRKGREEIPGGNRKGEGVLGDLPNPRGHLVYY